MSALHLPAAWLLGRRSLLTLSLQPGDQLRCERGAVWCTVDGSTDDLVLEAGDVYEAPAAQRLHACGLGRGRLALRPQACGVQRRAARDGWVSTSAPAAPSSTNSTRL